ncbi:MAG: cyclic nucleotide-binding domain-containing protein [Desulfobacterales bacterium]
MSSINEILAGHRFFRSVDPAFLRMLKECAAMVDFKTGEIIFRQGLAAKRFYVIDRGCVALEVHTPGMGTVVIETLGPGEIFGSSWLFPPYRYEWDARAVQDARAVAFNAECLRDICEADHDLGYDLMKRFAGIMRNRLQMARLQCLDIYRKSDGPKL